MQMIMNQIEQLLYTCDLYLLKKRQVMVDMLKSAESGMEERENAIKDQLKKIAILEMIKGKDEDEALDLTLKAVEMVNIADIAREKE